MKEQLQDAMPTERILQKSKTNGSVRTSSPLNQVTGTETAQVIKAVQNVIGYTDLHPTVSARLDHVYERLDKQDSDI